MASDVAKVSFFQLNVHTHVWILDKFKGNTSIKNYYIH